MISAAAATRRAADRERQRRCRAERRAGLAAYRVVANGEVINLLIRTGWLRDGDATKPQCVAAAISRLLADAAQK